MNYKTIEVINKNIYVDGELAWNCETFKDAKDQLERCEEFGLIDENTKIVWK